jgi:2-methylcitrate dehydratase PrpD
MATTIDGLTAGQVLGRFAAGVSADDLPAHVVEKLHCNLLHDLACVRAAHSQGPLVWDVVRGHGPAEATLLCLGEQVDAEHAAFANAVLMHARAQDDTHFAAKTHVGSAVIPAALALAEREGVGGRRLVEALIAGYEVAAAVGERFADETTARGFRASMLYGTLGAAAAGARVLDLDEDGTTHAIAIAASFAGGLSQTWIEGTSEWRWELGMAARNGVVAARLAASGAHGAAQWLEGAAGFARAFAGDASAGALSESWQLGERWRILDVIYKPYPVCNINQSPVELAVDLVNEHDVTADDIAAVRCYLNPSDRSYPGTLNQGPFTDVGATLMSAPFCVAMALKDRTATLAGLGEFDDEVARRLVERIEVLPDDALPPLGARLEITRHDGTTLSKELVPCAAHYGWEWEGVRRNVRQLGPEMADGGAGLDALEQAIRAIGELPSVGALAQATVA